MMKIETRIRIAAGIALGTAVWTILPDWRSHLLMFRATIGYAAVEGLGWAMLIVMLEAMLLGQLVSAIGLFRLQRWAWVLAVIALSAQVLLTSAGAMRLALLPPAPPPPITPGSTVTTLSLLPSYFQGIMNGIAVLILFSKGVRSHFLGVKIESHNHTSEDIVAKRAESSRGRSPIK